MSISGRYRGGKTAYVQWIWSGGTVTLHEDYTELDVDKKIELLDGTAGNAADKELVDGVKEASIRLKYYDTVTGTNGGTVLEAAMAEGNFGTLVWGRHGTVAGKPKRGYACYVESFKMGVPSGKLAEADVQFRSSGAAVYGVSSVWP